MIKIKDIKQDDQTLSVTVDFPDATGIEGEPYEGDIFIRIPVAALATRMIMYNLSTPEEALKAIVLEHARRINKETPNPSNNEEAVSMYQEDVGNVEMEMEVEDTNDVLDQNMPAIQEFIAFRTPDE